MKQSIFKNETKIRTTIETHLALVPQLQGQVDILEKNGLSPAIEDLKDLLNHGKKLKERAALLIEAEAKKTSSVKAIQEETISSLTNVYKDIISGVKSKLESILMAYSTRPKSLDAFIIEYGKVVPNLEWQKEVEASFTVESNEVREKTMELCGDVLSAIGALEKYLKNQNCNVRGFGVSGSGSDYLIVIDDENKAEARIINENFKYVSDGR